MTRPKRCYTIADICAALDISRRTFYDRLKAGKLPFLEELKPRMTAGPRYRADLVDRWLVNEFRSMRLVGKTGTGA